ncbi:hypothetical protein BV25DRAFT_1884520 [Artomyces pyxidatus]|uniref:Uncharacterized protein n=1 Tax=Artomyces pyxidatus TaxID=48021 RepID=A0ACB8T3C1_9AGAM|nr:hypothetical protein BV25DRAFT_1884520 [Artomyces pyxidatus]
MAFYHPTETFALSAKTLIVPVVSTANVSQLAADLLIASLSLQSIGLFDSRDLVPVIGGREDDQEGVTTPLELFGRDGVDIVVIQQRSPALKSRKQEFIAALLEFIQASHFKAVLFLSGVDLSDRTDAQMITPTYHISPPNSPSWENTPLSTLAHLPIPAYTSPVVQRPLSATNEGLISFIPGGGLTRRMLSSLPVGWPIPTASLLQFVVEGDNRADASLMAAVVAKVLAVDSLIKEWKQPGSWQQGLFGTPQEQTLYG